MTALLVKIMSGEDRPDSDTCKSYQGVVLGPGYTFEFYRDPDQNGTAYLIVTSPDDNVVRHLLTGNAYVVSSAGKTITSFGFSDCKVVS